MWEKLPLLIMTLGGGTFKDSIIRRARLLVKAKVLFQRWPVVCAFGTRAEIAPTNQDLRNVEPASPSYYDHRGGAFKDSMIRRGRLLVKAELLFIMTLGGPFKIA